MVKNTTKEKIEILHTRVKELEKEKTELLEALEDMLELVDATDYYNDTVQSRAAVAVARACKRDTKWHPVILWFCPNCGITTTDRDGYCKVCGQGCEETSGTVAY